MSNCPSIVGWGGAQKNFAMQLYMPKLMLHTTVTFDILDAEAISSFHSIHNVVDRGVL